MISGEEQVVIGGNESGIDAALNLAKLGKKVSVYTNKTGLMSKEADPSIRLAPVTRQKFFDFKKQTAQQGDIKLYQNVRIERIEKKAAGFELVTTDNRVVFSKNPPIICTVFFNGAEVLVPEFFETASGEVLLNKTDESTVSPNTFLIGPSVRNQGVIFCYIYKFRQRLAVIAEEIAKREQLSIDQRRLAYYQQQAFYLDDCENCSVDCTC